MTEKPALVWDEWNREHIKKHNVTSGEVEEGYMNEIARAEGKKKRLIILGRTRKERLLTIVLSFERQKGPYPVSARDISSKERRHIHEIF